MGLLKKLQGGGSKVEEAEEESAGSGSRLEPPPAYTSDDARSSTSIDAPGYSRPRFHKEGSAMAVLPPAFNVYASWKSTTKLWLGTSSDDKKYLVSHTFSWSNSKPPITVHNGLSTDDAPLVQVGPTKWKASQECTIRVPSRPDRPDPDLSVNVGYHSRSWHEWNYTFAMTIVLHDTDGRQLPPQEHTFQWRNTTGEEVRLLDGGSRWSSGWKLVWITGPEAGQGVGFGGDGDEVVAVAARSSKSLTKVLRFVYMGTGLTGTLGSDWELVVAATALQLWWHDQQATAVATATATAV